MDMKIYLQQATPEEREKLADEIESSVGYFYLIAGGHRRPSTDLCKKLVAKEPKLTLSALRPDVWPESEAQSIPTPIRSYARKPIDPKKVMT